MASVRIPAGFFFVFFVKSEVGQDPCDPARRILCAAYVLVRRISVVGEAASTSGGRRVDVNLLYRPTDRLSATEEEIINQIGQICNVYPTSAIDVGYLQNWWCWTFKEEVINQIG